MITTDNNSNKNFSLKIGRATALGIALATIIFALSLIWELIHLSRFATDLGYIASLLIAIGMAILMACFYDSLRKELKIFGLLALVSALIYAPLCITNYFLQLSIVGLNPLHMSDEVLELITFKPGSAAFAIDMLGYGFLCLSTFFAGFALIEKRNVILRILCFLHAALMIPTIASPFISRVFISTTGDIDSTGAYVLLFWCAVFLPIALLFMKYFKTNMSPGKHQGS